jgi:hypothetical protein
MFKEEMSGEETYAEEMGRERNVGEEMSDIEMARQELIPNRT